jgi:mRNA interferase RelE/StbE
VTCRLVISATAERHLQRLPERIAAAVVEFITGPLIEEPERYGKSLAPPFEGLLSARRGNYRIVYRIEEKTVSVLRVAHRSHVYRP